MRLLIYYYDFLLYFLWTSFPMHFFKLNSDTIAHGIDRKVLTTPTAYFILCILCILYHRSQIRDVYIPQRKKYQEINKYAYISFDLCYYYGKNFIRTLRSQFRKLESYLSVFQFSLLFGISRINFKFIVDKFLER